MIAANEHVAQSRSLPTPSIEATANSLGVDLAAEPELMHIVSRMRTTPLPPTWAVVDTVNTGQKPSKFSYDSHTVSTMAKSRNANTFGNTCATTANTALEYINRVTGERTLEHPGTSYFRAAVESERKNHRNLGRVTIVLEAPSEPVDNSGKSNTDIECNSMMTKGGGCETAPPSTILRERNQAHADSSEGVGDTDSVGVGESTSLNDTQSPTNKISEPIVVRREKPEVDEGRIQSKAAEGIGEDVEIGRSADPAHSVSSAKGKYSKRRPPPKWLVFTSWWHETVSGTENKMIRKHASIRYATANASFEVELEDVPAIFEVSHAIGRHGLVGTIDIRVGAQLSIMGRQMCLMQCDGLTAQWLESEVRAITKAKSALKLALEEEEGGDSVRVRCRSDRLEVSASAKRGSGSVGHAARMDRRALMQDVVILRDLLAQTRPEEAMRLTEGINPL